MFFFIASTEALPAPKALRIISLAPSATEILFALGLDEEIVGVSSYCNYPPRANKKERIGTFSRPNYEKIIHLAPDIVFATGLEQAYSVEQLRLLGIKVFVCHPSTFEELFSAIEEIAGMTERRQKGEALVNSMRSKLADIESSLRRQYSGVRRPRIFIEIWRQPLITAGEGSFLNDIIRHAGGENIAYDTPRPYSYISAETVIARDPECIIMGYMTRVSGRDLLAKRLGWGHISAVADGRVYDDIQPDVLMRPGPRSAQAVEELYKRLYR